MVRLFRFAHVLKTSGDAGLSMAFRTIAASTASGSTRESMIRLSSGGTARYRDQKPDTITTPNNSNNKARTMGDTLGDALPKEMARVRDKIMPAYADPALNGAGVFALNMMRQDLDAAARAMAEGDVVAMMACYEALKTYDV